MTAAGRPARDGLSIGAVLAQLRAEFPDVTISKIRFLESEGLVTPARTDSGYRQFSAADVERLRFVLTAQRDHYLPLKVIKDQLDGKLAPSNGLKLPRVLVPVRPQIEVDDEQPRRLTQEQLLEEGGIDHPMLLELEQYGLVRPGAAGFYDPDSVAVARTVKRMTDFGIEPRHLRAFRASADREVGLLEQIVTPMYRHRDPDARGRADEALRELASLSVALHTVLVKVGLRQVAGG